MGQPAFACMRQRRTAQRPPGMEPTQAPPDYVGIGFQKIHDDLAFLMGCLREMLESLGRKDLAAHVPWSGASTTTPTEQLPAELGLVYAIAFQSLNMVEEDAAAAMRVLRERHEGMRAERGLWG